MRISFRMMNLKSHKNFYARRQAVYTVDRLRRELKTNGATASSHSQEGHDSMDSGRIISKMALVELFMLMEISTMATGKKEKQQDLEFIDATMGSRSMKDSGKMMSGMISVSITE
jgi:hypothetical protein